MHEELRLAAQNQEVVVEIASTRFRYTCGLFRHGKHQIANVRSSFRLTLPKNVSNFPILRPHTSNQSSAHVSTGNMNLTEAPQMWSEILKRRCRSDDCDKTSETMVMIGILSVIVRCQSCIASPSRNICQGSHSDARCSNIDRQKMELIKVTRTLTCVHQIA